ncbi:MAG: NmrA/HSCARG family protein [Ignavibacteria bacterium]|nr:NmrA/HSCARG family protein [Ignavibacteria bacterium]
MEKAGKKILVTGATGLQGGAAVKYLIKNGWETSALVRDPEKDSAKKLAESGVTLIKGDMNDKDSLKKAMEGIYGVFSVQNFWEHGYEGELSQGKNLIDAARDAGVKHFVYSSVDGAERNTGLPHFDVKYVIEKYLAESGINYTILRPVFFMDNFNSWFVPAEQDGKFVISMSMKKDIKLQMIATDDIGRITEIVFNDPEKYSGKAIALAGDELTIPDAVKIYSEVKGGEYVYNELDVEIVKSQNKEVGDMFQWFMDHGYTADISDLKSRFGGFTDFKTWLKG